MSQVYEEDILNAGKKQVIISDDKLKVIIIPELGGRIADAQSVDVRFLYRTYPDGVSFGPYTEYGGVEECIGGAPGTLWNAQWKWELKDDGVLLHTFSKEILIRKFITLDESEPIIRIKYSLFNLGTTFSRFTFGIHPEIRIGESHKNNQYHVPSREELIAGRYEGVGVKRNITPSEGWCAVTCEDKAFGQMFPENTIDTVEIYYPRVDTHLVLQPMIYGVGISPDNRAEFNYMMYMGDGDAEKVKELRASRNAEFFSKYEPFDRAEIPKNILADMGKETARAENKVFAIHEMPHDILQRIRGVVPHEIPEIPQIPDVSRIVDNVLSNVSIKRGKTIKVGMADIRKAVRPEFKEPIQVDTTELSGKIINIEHVNGSINITGWKQSNINYTTNGNVKKDGDTVKFETTGQLRLNVPEEVSEIRLSFVNGDVSVSDIASSLKISGVNGKISINSKIADDGIFDVSLVSGDIKLVIPSDSSCNISAVNISRGEIECKIPLREETKTHTQLNGTLNAGTAKVSLSTISGKITIEPEP